MAWVIALAIAALLAAWAAVIRQGLARLRAAVVHAWSGLDALLSERHDELASIAAACRRHLPDESELIDRVLRAGGAVFAAAGRHDVPALSQTERQLRDALARLSATADSSQRLLGDADCCAHRERLACVQRALVEQREIYNSAVNLLNVRLQRWPERLIARAIGLQAAVPLEFTEARPAAAGPGG